MSEEQNDNGYEITDFYSSQQQPLPLASASGTSGEGEVALICCSCNGLLAAFGSVAFGQSSGIV